MSLENAVRALEGFERGGLTRRLAVLERAFAGASVSSSEHLCDQEAVNAELLRGLVHVKAVAGQINVAIHAVGILLALPRILESGEAVEYLSL